MTGEEKIRVRMLATRVRSPHTTCWLDLTLSTVIFYINSWGSGPDDRVPHQPLLDLTWQFYRSRPADPLKKHLNVRIPWDPTWSLRSAHSTSSRNLFLALYTCSLQQGEVQVVPWVPQAPKPERGWCRRWWCVSFFLFFFINCFLYIFYYFFIKF